MPDYTPKIPREQLEHGAYYWGRCRNANIARWNATTQKFTYWRIKFGHLFREEISAPESEQHFDVFVADRKINEHQGVRWIPFDEDVTITRDIELMEEQPQSDFLPQDIEGLGAKPITYLPYVEQIIESLNAMEDGIFTLGADAVTIPKRLYLQIRCALMRLKRIETITSKKEGNLPLLSRGLHAE